MSYRQPEAFCLMLYRSESGKEYTIWNSRNGVTPFVAAIDGEEFTHVEWGKDAYRPDHLPKVGDYVFVTLTEAEALKHRAEFVETFWDKGPHPLRDHYVSKYEATRDMSARDLTGNSPHMIQVTEDWLAGYVAAVENRSRPLRLPTASGRHG